ncbi:MAG: formyltetrahydrofolate deformylase [Gammaproteobacteria bacterium]|nr:formyltetrahydrofolate deformylase [Gammaproteobacteria bacterium]
MICFTFHCPDRPGIVAELSAFLAEHRCNILALEQHVEQDRFFIRIEWEDNGAWQDSDAFAADFSALPVSVGGELDIHFFNRPQSLGLFVSREPHALLEVLNKIELGDLVDAQVSFIIGNVDHSAIAARVSVPFYFVPTKDNPDFEAQQLEIIAKHNPDFIGLARYMKILSAEFIDRAACPIINIHHSFLPSFVGAKPYEMAYERGVKLMGATSHFVIPELDQGPIIEQDVSRIRSGYSVEKLKQIGRDTEKKVFAQALKKVLEHKTVVFSGRTVVFE